MRRVTSRKNQIPSEVDMHSANISAISRLRCGIDGPGIRTLVGFYGCPLRCKYCPNKFTYDGSHPPKSYTVEELIDAVKIDRPYFDATNGGITFGGGEPLLYSKFIEEFIIKSINAQNGLADSIVIETSLAVPNKQIVDFVELMMGIPPVLSHGYDREFVLYIDVKTLNPREYRKYTRKSIRNLMRNLQYISNFRGIIKTVIRVPVIDGYVTEKSRRKTVEKLRKIGFYEIEEFTYTKFK